MKKSHCLALIYIILFTANLQSFECKRRDDRSFTSVHSVSSSLSAYRFPQDISRYTTRTRQIRSPWGVPFRVRPPTRVRIPPIKPLDLPSFRLPELPTFPKFEQPTFELPEWSKFLSEREPWRPSESRLATFSQEVPAWWTAGAPSQKIQLQELLKYLQDRSQSRISPSSSADLPPSQSAGSPSRLSPPVELPPSLSEGVPQPQPAEPPPSLPAGPPSRLLLPPYAVLPLTISGGAPSRVSKRLEAQPPPSLSAGPPSRLLPPPSAELPSSVSGGAPSRVSKSLPAEPPPSLSAGPPSRLTPSQSLPTRSKHNRPNHNDVPSEESHRSSGTNQGNEFSESASRFYPGYKITNFTGGGNNSIKYINAGDVDFAQYFAAHFGEHGIPADTNIESDIRICKNITFCMPNTSPLCLMNGTVYCVTPLGSTVVCNETDAKMKCVNSTINLPCNTTTSANCNGKTINAISIPCVTIIHVFTTNVSRISKRSVVNTPNPGSKYCVTLAAEPIKKPEVPLDTSDEEHAQFLNTSDAMKEAAQKWFLIYVILQTISRYVFG